MYRVNIMNDTMYKFKHYEDNPSLLHQHRQVRTGHTDQSVRYRHPCARAQGDVSLFWTPEERPQLTYSQIIVLGNGFDLAQHIPSSYSAFFRDRYTKYRESFKKAIMPRVTYQVNVEDPACGTTFSLLGMIHRKNSMIGKTWKAQSKSGSSGKAASALTML